MHREGPHVRTHGGKRIHTSPREHRWMHAQLRQGRPCGNHTHYDGDRRGERHAVGL